MPIMESRKIQLVGKRTYAVSLPKNWVVRNNLKEKDFLFIEDIKDDELLIKASDKGVRQEKSITIDLHEAENIDEFIVFCYMKNIKKITIKGKMNSGALFEIKNIVKYLEGYEITNETGEKIEISFLFEGVNVNIHKIINRMIYLLQLMVDLTEEKNFEELRKTEDKIDSLYFLSRRVLFSCAKNPALRKSEKICDSEDVFFYLDIVKKFEALGDLLFRNQKADYSKQDFKNIREILEGVYSCYYKKENTIIEDSLFITKNENVKEMMAIMKSLIKDIRRSTSSIKMNKKFFGRAI